MPKQMVKLFTKDGGVDVEAKVLKDGLCIHRPLKHYGEGTYDNGWKISHVRSGFAVSNDIAKLYTAKEALEEFLKVCKWDCEMEKIKATKHDSKAYKRCKELYNKYR